jgi:hypothetical protein
MTDHIISNSRAQQYREMEKLLDAGNFVLMGFVVERDGFRPISFTFGQGFDVADAVKQLTPGMAVFIDYKINSALTVKEKVH